MALIQTLAITLCFVNPPDIDTDRDGLSDFQEIHKYFTDPAKADSDGDGIPDADWNERRENAYTVRAIVQVLRPVTPDVFCDDYQDARILDETDEYIELEVVLYPLNTVAGAIVADPKWRATAADMREWTQAGPTANWDAELRDQIVAKLRAEGVDPDALDDRTLVERASQILLRHANYVDGFTTFCSRFVNGHAEIMPGMEQSARDGQAQKNLTLEEQWQRELFAKGMFTHGTRGSCTSTAIYLNGCLRALGIPTRIVLAIPIIDSSDERERSFIGRLRHNGVRHIIERGTEHLANSWSSHTFNEVFVGNRWRRLNFDKLGQNILDPNLFGLIVHVATLSDWADGNMAANWGLRQARKDHERDAFGGPNPYSTVTLSDRFGTHATIDNPPPPDEIMQLTIDRAWWFSERPAGVDMRLDDPKTAGHVVVHVVEGQPGEGTSQYKKFYDAVGKDFILRAKGRPDVPLHATRGYWAAPAKGLQHFYLRIEPSDFKRMVVDVPYRLIAKKSENTYRWIVRPKVTLTRSKDSNKTATTRPDRKKPAQSGPNGDDVPGEVTLDQVIWSDAPDSPTGPLEGAKKPVLLARMGKRADFDRLKQFSAQADRRFFLEADGHPTLKVGAAIGGVTAGDYSYLVIELGPADWDGLVSGVEYTIRPQNSNADFRWRLKGRPRFQR